MSKRGDITFVQDIEEAIKRIDAYTCGMDYKEFFMDKKTQDAVVRNLEIIGEATKNVSEELKQRYPDIPWKDFARVRDKLIHFYHGVNYDVVWDIAANELPSVLKQVERIIRTETI
ncbi:MAG: DUF86 domain-containing protein [Nitrospirae bacterium]|nr:DUF86 domain-containing protein [Nitrospirota bacterium]